MAGTALIAWIIAKPMMWVKLTLPPRLRRRKLLMVARFSTTSFIGTVRTEVAVGMERDASMFRAVRIGAPFITVRRGPVPDS